LTNGINDTGGKLATGIKHRAPNFTASFTMLLIPAANLTPVNDTGDKFAACVNDTGGKRWD
jgi:hypothetical protein